MFEQKKKKYSDDFLLEKIEYKMDQIAYENFSSAEINKKLDEIQMLIKRLHPENQNDCMTYYKMFYERIANPLLKNNNNDLVK